MQRNPYLHLACLPNDSLAMQFCVYDDLTEMCYSSLKMHVKRKHCLTIINNSNANIDRLYFILVWFVRVFFYRFYAQARISSPSHVIQPFPPPTVVFLCHLTAVAHKMRGNASGKNAKIRHSEKT